MRKPISWLLTLAMVFTMLPMSVFAADPVPQKTVSTAEDSPVQITKTLSDDGSSITMEAYVTGDVEVSSQTKPLDIVLVLDTSGSMGDKFGTGINYYTPTNKAWETNEIEGKYILVDGVYYRIEKKYNWDLGATYTVYYTKDRQRITIGKASLFGTAYTGTLYTADYSRMGALKNAVNNFIDSVTEKSTATAPHQISIVTFAGGANTVKGLTSVQGTGATELKNAVDALSANGATRADLGLAKAKDVLNNGRTNTSKVVVFFTDGQPTSSSGFEKSVAHGAINSSKALKDSGTTVYTIGVMEGANPADTTKDINKYMNAVSSKYPNATSEYEEAGSFKPEKWTVTLGDPAAKDYYFTASDPDGLNDVFQTISEETGSADVPVDATSMLYDTLSEYFAFPANASSTAKVQLADYKGNGEWGNPYAADGITPVIERKTISVTGFNYAENYVWDNSEAAAKFGGKKLILTFPIEADKECAAWQAPGLYDTNSQAGLTYGEGVTTTLDDSPNMKVDTYQVTYNWGEPDTAVTSQYTKPTDTRYYIPGQSYTVDDECTNTTAVNVTDEYGNINGTYTFSGWKLGDSVVTGEQTIDASNVELKGEWTFAAVNVPGYKVTYDWGTTPTDVYDAEKKPVTLILPTDSEEYVKGESYPVNNTYAKDYTVYTHDANGNDNGKYIFSGWTAPNNGVMTEDGATITGEWKYEKLDVQQHTVTYQWADGKAPEGATLPADKTVDHNASYTPTTTYQPVETNKGTWTFEGWNPAHIEHVTKDEIITGTWTFTPATSTDVKVTYKVVNGTWADGSTEITVTLAPDAPLGDIPDVSAVKPNTNYLAKGTWDVEPVKGTAITKPTTYTYTLEKNERAWENTYKYIRIYMDEGTQADFDALEGSLSQQVRIYSEKYLLEYRLTAPLNGYWWTENSRSITANDISSIVLAKNKLGEPSAKIEIPMAGNDLYSVSVSEETGIYPFDGCEYTYLCINITKKLPVTKTITFTYVAGANGSLTGAESETVTVQVDASASPAEVPTPKANEGYKFAGWQIGEGSSAALVSSEDLLKMSFSKDTTFTAIFKEKGGSGVDVDDDEGGGTIVTKKYEINASAGKGGDISPEGTVKVNKGAEKSFAITADKGYKISDVLVDGKSVGKVSSYTFKSVKEDHTIKAIFAKLPTDPDDSGTSNWLNTKDHFAYMNGYPDSTFGPNRNMTRAEVAQMFYALLLDKDVTTTVAFSDVPANAWYAKAVNTLASLGMVTGYPDGTFHPDASITRAEFATIAMAFAYELKGADCNYYDVPENAWFYTYVAQATTYGWIGGSNGYFRPNDMITRAEVSVIANNMLGRAADEDYVDKHEDDLVTFPDVKPSYWAYYSIMETVNDHEYTKDNGLEDWK